MREGGRANALLVELLLVILFFMLSATTIVELFAGAKHKTVQARATSEAIMEAQNIADDLYGADDPDAVLNYPQKPRPLLHSRRAASRVNNASSSAASRIA